MHYAVHGCLLSRSSGSLERTCRVVHPYVNTLHKILGHSDVIVRNENNLSDETLLL